MISLKTINELQETENFFVPNYQRGYKWTTKQVEALLSDIMEFAYSSSNDLRRSYCLQPIVLKEMDPKDKRILECKELAITIRSRH